MRTFRATIDVEKVSFSYSRSFSSFFVFICNFLRFFIDLCFPRVFTNNLWFGLSILVPGETNRVCVMFFAFFTNIDFALFDATCSN